MLPALDQDQDNYLFITASPASLGSFIQGPTSNTLFTLDYSEYMQTDETLQSVAYTVTPATTPPLSVNDSTIVPIDFDDGKGVSFTAGGGVIGTVYQLTVTATTSVPQTKVDSLAFQIGQACQGVAYPVCWPPGSPPPGTSYPPATGVGSSAEQGTLNFSSVRVPVGMSVIQLAPQRAGRHAVTIINTGYANVTISHLPSFSMGDGTPLPAGAATTIETQAVVYGLADNALGQVAVQETY